MSMFGTHCLARRRQLVHHALDFRRTRRPVELVVLVRVGRLIEIELDRGVPVLRRFGRRLARSAPAWAASPDRAPCRSRRGCDRGTSRRAADKPARSAPCPQGPTALFPRPSGRRRRRRIAPRQRRRPSESARTAGERSADSGRESADRSSGRDDTSPGPRQQLRRIPRCPGSCGSSRRGFRACSRTSDR